MWPSDKNDPESGIIAIASAGNREEARDLVDRELGSVYKTYVRRVYNLPEDLLESFDPETYTEFLASKELNIPGILSYSPNVRT